jgi:hypothetical protein
MNIFQFASHKNKTKFADALSRSRKLTDITWPAAQLKLRRARVCKLEECQVVFLVDWIAHGDEDESAVYCSQQHANRDRLEEVI